MCNRSRLFLPVQDFDSGWFTFAAQRDLASFQRVAHGLGGVPARVKVLTRATEGDNERFVFEGAGTSQTDDNQRTYHWLSLLPLKVSWFMPEAVSR